MTTTGDGATINCSVIEPFPSTAALRAAHGALLQRRRADGTAPGFLDDVAQFIQRGQATGVLIDADEERAASQSLLNYWANVLYRAGSRPPDATLAEFDPSLAPELPDEACPYVGLDAFRETDHQRFFGRRQFTIELVERLEQQRLLVVVGPSGSGKSSLVRAGVIPALREGALAGSQEWRYLPPIVPGSEPLRNLARLIGYRGPTTDERLTKSPDISGSEAAQGPQAAEPAPQPAEAAAIGPKANLQEQVARFRQDPGWLTKLLGDTPTVLTVDQFEEVFTLVEDEEARQAFVANLLALVDVPDPRHTVILTMRSDFETFVARVPALEERLAATRVQMMPLGAAELREAIEAPAAVVGLKFEPGLVDLLLQDILGEPAGLPLLQFTLLKLWEQRERNRVTLAAYEQVGGGRRALARSADAWYGGLIPEEQITARRMLLRMVRPGEGLEITSNRVQRAALYQGREDPGRVERVLAKLVGARLVRLTAGETPDDDQVEVAHEALVRNWPTLVEWLDDERAAIATRRRFEAKANEWVRLGSSSAGLLDEVQLLEAERWLASPEAAYLGYDTALPALVVASKEALDAAEREQETARRRELDQARALAAEQERRADAERQRAEEQQRRAEEQSRSRRRLRVMVVALAIASIFAVLAAFIAAQNAAQASMFASEQERRFQTEATARALESVLRSTAEAAEVTARANAERASSNEATAVAAQQTAVAAGQESEHQRLLARAGQLAAQAQAALERQPQRSLLLAVEALKTTDSPVAEDTLRNALSISEGRGLSGHAGPVTDMAISPDGHWLATGSADQSVRLWDLTAPDPAANARVLSGHTGPVTAIAISPDGRWLVSGSDDRTARLWDLQASEPGKFNSFLRTRGRITALAISPDSRRLILGSDAHTAELWTLTATGSGGSPSVLSSHQGPITALAFAPDGRWLVSGSSDRTARLWDLQTVDRSNAQPIVLSGHAGPITALAISPDSRWLVTTSDDRSARVWDLAAQDPTAAPHILRGHDGALTAATVIPDSRGLITGSEDHTIRIWDLSPAADWGSKVASMQLTDLVDQACRAAGRNLTEEEWKQFFPGEDYRKTCAQ